MSKFYKISGELTWVKKTPDQKYPPGYWTLNVKPDEEGLKTLLETGLNLSKKSDGSFTFRRPTQKLFKTGLKIFDPPKFLIREPKGDIIEMDKDTLIGNGSKGVVKLEVYQTASGFGHRYESVLVTDLISYTPPENRESREKISEFKNDLPSVW